jgi:feruloyl esterase
VEFYETLVKDLGPQRAGQGVRLFMAPGMAHCAGGAGPSSLDMLGEIDRWVETGVAPQRIIARNPAGLPPRSRPLCPHPQVAVHVGQGSTDEEANFRCAAVP